MDDTTASEPAGRRISRRRFLQGSAATAGSLWLGGMATPRAGAWSPKDLAGMNVVVFLTDQERAIQHFPRGWARRNLPGLTQLQRHGVTFENAFTNACMCSPARSTLQTGYFPAQHGVRYTLEEGMEPPTHPQVEMPTPDSLANTATVMSAAGYNVVYKGKWHCSKPAGPTWAPSDLADYGFGRWNPDDAGANQSIPEMGGGIANNDGRFMTSVGDPGGGDEGALQFLTSAAAAQPVGPGALGMKSSSTRCRRRPRARPGWRSTGPVEVGPVGRDVVHRPAQLDELPLDVGAGEGGPADGAEAGDVAPPVDVAGVDRDLHRQRHVGCLESVQ